MKMNINKLPSVSELNKYFDYDPASGVFTHAPRNPSHFKSGTIGERRRRTQSFNSRFAGKEIRNLDKSGYLNLYILKKRLYAHRVAFKIVHGFDPNLIDHINRNRADNRIQNLRDASHFSNGRNRNANINNTSGAAGVYFAERDQVWRSRISYDGKRICLGDFKDFDEAVAARKKAELIYEYSGD